MLRCASIGMGWWSDELADAVHGKSDAIRIVTCFTRSAEKRAAFAEKYGTGTHESYEAVLADGTVDAVILTTPHSIHAEQVIAAAQAGKHVFCEKPFTLTRASAQAAVDACAQAGVVLAIGQNRRWHSGTRALKAMLEAGDFGTLVHAEANFSVPSALDYPPELWRANRVESPAGSVTALGIHMIDALVYLLGPVARVAAQAHRRAVPVDIDDTTSVLLTFESGASGYLGTFFACPHPRTSTSTAPAATPSRRSTTVASRSIPRTGPRARSRSSPRTRSAWSSRSSPRPARARRATRSRPPKPCTASR